MIKMTNRLFKLLSLALVVLLASCGGGGGGGGGGDSSGEPVTARPTSYWSMDAFTFQNGGNSTVTSRKIGDSVLTVGVVSTATLAGGDKNNGAYSGSALTFMFAGTKAGTYQVTDMPTLVTADPTSMLIVVGCDVGSGVTTGGTSYTATAGQVNVSIDEKGQYHFDSVGALTTTKGIEVAGGVAGAPVTMALTIHDAY